MLLNQTTNIGTSCTWWNGAWGLEKTWCGNEVDGGGRVKGEIDKKREGVRVSVMKMTPVTISSFHSLLPSRPL